MRSPHLRDGPATGTRTDRRLPGAAGLAAAFVLAVSAALSACGSRVTEPAPEPPADLVVYSSHPAEMVRTILREFRDRTGLRVRVVAGGTGELLGRLRSGDASPRADLLWGGGAESLAAVADLLEPYVSPEAAAVPEGLKDPKGAWTGFTVLPMVMIVNDRLLPPERAPRAWADLGSERLRGSVAYADPSVSGSAYTILRTLLLAGGGGEAGWSRVAAFARILEGNVLPESSQVFRGVASGEYLAGLTYETAVTDAGRSGSDVRVVYPADGTSAIPDCVALVRGAPHPEAARAFVDFVLGPDVAAVVAVRFGRRSARADAPAPEGLPPLSSLRILPYDVERSAAERAGTLARFRDLLAGAARP